MTYYIYIQNEKLNGCGQCRQLTEGVKNLEVDGGLYNAYAENPDMYIWDGLQVIIDPEYEAKQAQKEKERIAKLTRTKRVFALMLQELGITYTMLKQLIATNEQAQLEWDLCVELERQNPLLDVMALQLGITSEQLDGLFRYANGEITMEQFRELIPEPEEPIEPSVEETEPVEVEEDVI
jgi:hypothetical protein